MFSKLKIFFLLVFCSLILPTAGIADEPVTDEAERIFKTYQGSVFQIRVVDLATGKKSAAGSGFQISPQGHVATNFHVISDAVHYPKRYKIMYFGNGASGTLEVRDIDVVHDLAITQSDSLKDKPYLEVSITPMVNGARIYALGNLLDYGMKIVEGNYNGRMENSLYQKILFSGALEQGMSGGPTLDHDGRVVGVNVSTRGNSVSFLVPIEYLHMLLVNATLPNAVPHAAPWDSYIEEQLLRNQERYVGELLANKWESVPLGKALLPGEIAKTLKCWGASEDKDKKLYKTATMSCENEESLFISDTLSTGSIFYQHQWITSKKLNPVRFYNFYGKLFKFTYDFNSGEKEDLDNFTCESSIVHTAGRDWKMVLCTRHYKKYPRLLDVNVSVALVDELYEGLWIELGILGVSKDNAKKFVRKFTEEITWQK